MGPNDKPAATIERPKNPRASNPTANLFSHSGSTSCRRESEWLGFHWARPAGSFTILLAVLLLLSYFSLWAFYPWRPLAELDVPGWIVDFADQVDLMMTSRNPPVVILGSSLTLAAPRRLRKPNIYQDEISKASGLKLSACCMAVPGAIASDQDFILSQLLEHHKKPSFMVYTYAPRDFMDNTIEGKITSTPVRRVLTFINRRSSFWPKALTLNSFEQCFENHAAFLDLVRRHVLRTVRAYVCKISGHPDSLWTAQLQKSQTGKTTAPTDGASAAIAGETTAQGEKPPTDEQPQIRAEALAKDLELYNRRYNPQNPARIDEQYHHLETLLRLCHQNDIELELIGMPISPANQKLLANGVYLTMVERLQSLATKYSADLYDVNLDPQVKFRQDEYLDSVHLSTSGAAHFVPLMVDKVVHSHSFKTAFAAKASVCPQ